MHPYEYGFPLMRQQVFNQNSNLNNFKYYPYMPQNRIQQIYNYPENHYSFNQPNSVINTRRSLSVNYLPNQNQFNQRISAFSNPYDQIPYHVNHPRVQRIHQNQQLNGNESENNIALTNYFQPNNFNQINFRSTGSSLNYLLPSHISERNQSNFSLLHNVYHKNIESQIPFIQADLQNHKEFLEYLSQFYSVKGKKHYDLHHEEYLIQLFKNKSSFHIQLLQHFNLNYRLVSSALKNSIQKIICQKYPASLNYVNEYKKIKQIYSIKTSSFIKLINQIVSFTKAFQTKTQFQWNINKFCLCIHLLNQNIFQASANLRKKQNQLLIQQISQEIQLFLSKLIQNQQSLSQFFEDQNLYLKLTKAIFTLISIFSFDKLGQSFDLNCQSNILKNVEDLISLYALKQIDICQTLRLLCVELIKQYLQNKNTQEHKSKILNLVQKKLFTYTLNKMFLLKTTKWNSSQKSAKKILKQLLFYIQMSDLLQKDANFQKENIYILKKRFMDHVCTKKKQL